DHGGGEQDDSSEHRQVQDRAGEENVRDDRQHDHDEPDKQELRKKAEIPRRRRSQAGEPEENYGSAARRHHHELRAVLELKDALEQRPEQEAHEQRESQQQPHPERAVAIALDGEDPSVEDRQDDEER